MKDTPTSVFDLFNKCKTPMGKREFRERLSSPIADIEVL